MERDLEARGYPRETVTSPAVAKRDGDAEQLREPQAAERFRREAQAAARLKHPNAVTIYDFGVSDDGVVYLVMELVEGQSLRKVVKDQGPLFPSAAAEILTQVCGALHEAHDQNVVHRDIKPDNILVTMAPTGVRVKVLDFGIARIRDMSSLGNLTQTGSIMGTPHYMSPEQCLGEELDGRSDIYSLGIVLYEMLTGVVPFNSPTSMAVAVHHVNTAPAPLRVLNASVPPAVETVVMRALEKRREARPQTAAAFAGEFSAAVAATLSAPAGRSTAVGASPHVPTMMPTVQMRTPWSTGAAQVPTPHGSPLDVHQGHVTRKRLPVALIGGVAVVVIAGVGSASFFLSREGSSPPAAPVQVATSPVTTPPTSPPDPLSPEPTPPPEVSPNPPLKVPVPSPGPQAGAPTVDEGAPEDPAASANKGDITIRMLPGSTVQIGAYKGTAGAEGFLVLPKLRPGRHLLVVRKDGRTE